MITNHSRTGLRPDKRVIICVAIIFGSTTSPVEPTIHVPYTRFGALNFERQWELSVFVMSELALHLKALFP